MVTLLATLAILAPNDEITRLEALVNALSPATAVSERMAVYADVEETTRRIIAEDQVKEAADFRRVAKLLELGASGFRTSRTAYELTLTALAAGDTEAGQSIGLVWDNLLVSMSRGRRLGLMKIHGSFGMARYRVNPTASVIRNVYQSPSKYLVKARQGVDDPAVKAIVDADQKAREGDWSKFTQKDFERMAPEDAARLTKIKEIVKRGDLVTANDFDNAALVCQHGETFEDYALAHELSVCALLLGKKSASWLAGASYDRMFANSGYPQRFATQYSMMGGVTKLSQVDTEGINDTMRKIVVRTTLAEAQNRKWD